MYGAGVSISSVLINNSDINFVFHVFTDYVDDDYLKSFNETAKQFNTSIIVYLIDPKYFADLPDVTVLVVRDILQGIVF